MLKLKRKKALEGYSFDPIKDGVSQSVLHSFLGCRELCRMTTVLGYAEPGPSWPLVFGTISHNVLELVPKHGPSLVAEAVDDGFKRYWRSEECATSEHKAMAEEAQAILHVLMPAYVKRWWKQNDGVVDWVGIEHEFRIPFEDRGYTMVGKMDGVFKDRHSKRKLWLLESKNKSRFPSSYDMWLGIDLQLQYYIEACVHALGRQPDGVVYNMLRRPERLTKKAKVSPSQQLVDLRNDVAKRPDHHFQRYKVLFTPAELAWHSKSVHAKLAAFVEWFKNLDKTQRDPLFNPGACSQFGRDCFCLPSCASDDRSGLTIKSRPHPELGN